MQYGNKCKMELTVKNLAKLWDQWIGSPEMVVPKSLTRPVNFLGSEKKYKESFLNFVNQELKNE